MTRIMRRCDSLEKETSQDLVVAFQKIMKAALIEQGMTQTDFAALLGVTRPRISHLLMDDANPSIRYVGLVLFRLGYTMEFKKRPCD